MQVPKDRFTLSYQEADNYVRILQVIYNELRAAAADGQSLQQSGQPAANAAQAPPPQAMESASKQLQTGGQNHKLPQRPSSKDALPPAAPTSTQPPFQIGAASPDGKPVYATTPQMTQGDLYLPRKKMRTGMPTSSPAGGSQTASPQTKVASPDLRKQQEPKPTPQRPTFPCTTSDCEMGGPVFSSEALRKKHVDEFHTQPFQDPAQFLEDAITEVFDHFNQAKADAAPPQGNAFGGPGAQNSKPENKNGPASKGADIKVPGLDAQPPVADNNMANGTIDPQSLFAQAFSFDPIAGGVISNTSLYRSTTPNEDTPESSKDSGASEPSSDIPEAGSLDIDIDLLAPDLYLQEGFQQGFNLNSPGGDKQYHDDVDRYYAASMIEHIVANRAYEIPQSIDMSLYSMDC